MQAKGNPDQKAALKIKVLLAWCKTSQEGDVGVDEESLHARFMQPSPQANKRSGRTYQKGGSKGSATRVAAANGSSSSNSSAMSTANTAKTASAGNAADAAAADAARVAAAEAAAAALLAEEEAEAERAKKAAEAKKVGSDACVLD